MDVRSEQLYFLASAQVSAVDGIAHDTVTNAVNVSAYLGNFADFMHRMLNRVNTASVTLALGGSNGSIAVNIPAASAGSAIQGLVHGVPFSLSTAVLSGSPASGLSTASNQIRKVGVALVLSSFTGLPSSFLNTAGTIQFVYGPAMTTPASAVLSGGQSGYFNSVALPKFSADQIPLGILNIPNAKATSGTITTDMIEKDARMWKGANLSLIMANV